MNKLENARIKINEIDKKMAELFEQRMDAVCDVVAYKMQTGKQIFDSSREQIVIENNKKNIKNPEYIKYYEGFIQDVMNNSKEYQKFISNQNVVGYQGTKGAFSYIASKRIFPKYHSKSFKTFEDVFKAIQNKEIFQAVIPFENSYTGEVGGIIDLLTKYDCYIDSIYDLKIDQNLLGVKGSKISDIKKVFSHEQALAQSKQFLEKYEFELSPYGNTALAAEFVAQANDKSYAAVAAKDTAKLYGLEILKENINTSKQNTTRFIVILNKLNEEGNRFNASFKTKHKAGSLARILGIIGNEGFNVENIKSIPIPDVLWEHYFYIEIEGKLEEEKTKKLISKMEESCEQFKILGSYFK